MAAIRSVSSSATYEQWFKPPTEARAVSLEVIVDIYIDFSDKEGTRQQRGVKPAPRTLISDLQQKLPQREKWLRLLIKCVHMLAYFRIKTTFLLFEIYNC